MKLVIKNMVCSRCKMVVKAEVLKLGLEPILIVLGEVELKNDISESQKKELEKNLKTFGFELLHDSKSIIVEKIKNLIVELIQNQNDHIQVNLSVYLSEKIHQDYQYLSNTFSESEGTTIEKYFILQKIEKVKELLVYNEYSLSEIAFKLNYSSVGYLSNQFKNITGLTPTHFKQLKFKNRLQIEDI